MRRILFYIKIFGISYSISSYIFFNLLAALYFFLLSYKYLNKEGINKKKICIMSLLSIVSFFIGARLLYAVLYIEKIIDNPYKLIQFKLVNFSLYGGFVVAYITLYLLSKTYKFDILHITDSIIPHLGISVALSKIGCFLNGCCYGIPTKMPWGVVFLDADKSPFLKVFGDSSFTNLIFSNPPIKRHPTQIYDIISALIASIVATILIRKKVKSGITTAVFLIVFSIGRFISFLFRDFPDATFLSNLIRGPIVYGSVILACILFVRHR